MAYNIPVKLLTFEHIIDKFKEKGILSKLEPFEDTDYCESDGSPLLMMFVKFINETIFCTQKIMIPAETRIIIGNIIGIFNFEFCYYFIIHQFRNEIFKNKLNKLLKCESLEELRMATFGLYTFLGVSPNTSKLDSAILAKDFSKLGTFKSQFSEFFQTFFDSGKEVINSIDEFVCTLENCWYQGSFLMNASDLLKEFFAPYPEMNPSTKFNLMIKEFCKDQGVPVSFQDLKNEFLSNIMNRYIKEEPIFEFTDNFWDEFANSLLCFLLLFNKEVSMTSALNFRNMKLRVKSNTIIEIMKNLIPRHKIFYPSQINFLQWVVHTKTQYSTIKGKKFKIRTSASSN